MLRPETLESLYYLYWITREDVYRDQAWEIFEAFEEHCRVDRGGYAGLVDVTDVSPHLNNHHQLPPKFDRLFYNRSVGARPKTSCWCMYVLLNPHN